MILAMKDPRKLLVVGMALGGALMLAPMFGMIGTVFGMMRAFHTLGSSGISDPTQLSHSIGITMMSSMVGLALFPIGLILLVICVVIYNQHRRPSPPPIPAAR